MTKHRQEAPEREGVSCDEPRRAIEACPREDEERERTLGRIEREDEESERLADRPRDVGRADVAATDRGA